MNDADADVYDRLMVGIDEEPASFTLDRQAERELCEAVRTAGAESRPEQAMWYRDPSEWRFAGRVEAMDPELDEELGDNRSDDMEPGLPDSAEGDLEDAGWLGHLQEAEDTLVVMVDAKYMLGFEQRSVDLTIAGARFHSSAGDQAPYVPQDEAGTGELFEPGGPGAEAESGIDLETGGADPEPFNVDNPDDRSPILDATQLPWRRSAALRGLIPGAVGPDGEEGLVFASARCSAAMVGPRLAITAAHCIYNRSSKAIRPSSIVPAQQLSGYFDMPYGHFPVRYYTYSSNYAKYGNSHSDWALLTLDDHRGYWSWYGAANRRRKTLKNRFHDMPGYPGSIAAQTGVKNGNLGCQNAPADTAPECGGRMYNQSGKIHKVYAQRLKTRHDNFKGQSGSGLVRTEQEVRGVLVADDGDYAIHRRVTWGIMSHLCGQLAANPSNTFSHQCN